MATVPATPITNRARREMQEVKAPEMFKFTKPGEILSGVLLNIEPTTVREKAAIEYMLQDDRGQRLTFLGTNDLDKKIQPAHIGHWLDIRYERDDNSFTKPGQSAAKIFKVLVSKEKEAGF
jgi:hypothetical protein